MEVDRILYIFGSFSRKKDKRKSLDQSSISAGNSPLHTKVTPRPASQNLVIPPRTSAYELKTPVKEWECKLCGKELVEPRLLSCLHSFCTRCLQDLPERPESWGEVDVPLDPGESRSGSGAGSAGSGYESDLRHSGSDTSWDQKPHKYGIVTKKVSGKMVQVILCPTCGYETPLPLAGISALPLNYVLLRKMVATRDDALHVLCDLCNSDSKAESRCNQCLVSVCSSCGEAHSRQSNTARHSLQPLDPVPLNFCSIHPRTELNVYCATCQQVVCRECCVVGHCGHALGGAARAAGAAARRVRDAARRAAHTPEHAAITTRELHAKAYQTDSQAALVESEIQSWCEQYRRAVEAHGRALLAAAARARSHHARSVERAHRQIQDTTQHAVDAVRFAEELLANGRESELLSLSDVVVRRLEVLTETPTCAVPRLSLRFAPTAPAGADSTLVGRLLTEAPDPASCVVTTEGFRDLTVNVQHEAVLELRDSNGDRIWCGGEQVCGYFRRRDSSARPAAAAVTDRTDGTYVIAFTPPAPGAYLLAVTVNNNPVKGSPFLCCARVGRAHSGQYHCCAFCSSGGKKDATCACGATMPGGYKGCGHGHTGWPGSRHWSCCGVTQRDAPCSHPVRNKSKLYQFSL